MTLALLGLASLLLAAANGANDNSKGVATLFGSGTADYRRALGWATFATAAGCLASVGLANGLAQSFRGAGLVPDAVAGEPAFALAVALGAALTVALAARFGLPISTTHALTGALAGAALVAAPGSLRLGALASKFLAPLLFSPLAALALGAAAYLALRGARGRLGLAADACLCLGPSVRIVPGPAAGAPLSAGAPGLAAAAVAVGVEPAAGSRAECAERFPSGALAVPVGRILDGAHYATAGLVSFGRGVNDAPKLAALLLAARALDAPAAAAAVAAAMALGALGARRVAETLGRRITPLSPGQGLSANLATSALVLAASGWGLPVSTTHVACGSLFGIGLLTGRADRGVVRRILLAWVGTLPLAAALAAAAYSLLG